MVRMIPPYARAGANLSEKRIFDALDGLQGHDEWIAIHSLSIGRHVTAFAGEADFIVLIPGKGIVVIEAKAPRFVEYKAGDWYLDRVPNPQKDPLKQLDGVRRSIRGYLNNTDLLRGDEPIARLVWFTTLGRFQFENQTPGDLQFFEWELGWKDDLAKPAWLLQKTLDEYSRWYATVDAVSNNPSAFTTDHAKAIANALVGDFTAKETESERRQERQSTETRLLASQQIVLELTDTNSHVYFDGPAGTGKSYLITSTARRFNKEGRKTLVACWNVLMAEELQRFVGTLPEVEVADFNSLMLRLAGVPTNPLDAGHHWYTHELPTLALSALNEKPYLGDYEAICVDEFQDIAGNHLLLDLIFQLAGTKGASGTRLVFAGDSRQQIMRRADEYVNAYTIARERIHDLVHVRVERNCRSAPSLLSGVEQVLGQKIGYSGHRVAKSTPGELEVVAVSEGRDTAALTATLKSLLHHHSPQDIVILSPFASKRSLVGRFLARDEQTADERWLRKQLQRDGMPGRVRWRSIFKFKGLDAEAVILTDLGDDAREFVSAEGLDWQDLLYVGLTRAKYRCMVLV